MRTKALYIWELLRTSFWFLPLCLILLAIGAAFGLVYLDSQIGYQPSGILNYFFSGSVDSARNVLSIIAGAMLGVASTVFSITLVALTLASSQFGSRLLRNFMHDRLNQVVLGTYVATFIYCLLVLQTLRSGDGFSFVPNFSVLAAIVVAVGNILLLIIFIHHISVSIQADNVISDISSKLTDTINQLFPEELGDENGAEHEKKLNEAKEQRNVVCSLLSDKSGYLQGIDNDSLMQTVQKYDLLLILNHRPGNFIVEKEAIATVYSGKEVSFEILKKLRSSFLLGRERTPIQDAEFAVHQVVEIASRALSPGVNDPYTAITCIDKLTENMCFLTRIGFPSNYRYGSDGSIRVVTRSLNFEGMMDVSFNQIRQYGQSTPTILIHLMDSFIKMNKFVQTDLQKKALIKHAMMVLDAGESGALHSSDRQYLKERFDEMEPKAK